MGTGQRVALFIGLLLFLAGIGVGVRPLGHATGALGTLYCTDDSVTAIGQGDCPSHTYELNMNSGVHTVDRNCGSAFLPAAYDSGAIGSGAGSIPAGVTQRWAGLPPCGHQISTWRYRAVALLATGAIAALAGFFIFRTRKLYPNGAAPTPAEATDQRTFDVEEWARRTGKP
jgi:hypothetical protein